MKQTEILKEYLIKSLNLAGASVLVLQKGKDRVEYEALAIHLIEEDAFDKGCNMAKTCFPNAPEPCDGKVPEVPPPPPPPPCDNTPTSPTPPETPNPGGGGGGD